MNPGGLFVSSSGLVGIGTTSPALPLTIFNSNAATLYQTAGTGTGGGNGFYVGHTGNVSYVYNYNAFPLVLATNNTERMRIDSGGNVGIGTTAPDGKLHVFSSTAGTITPDANSNLFVLEDGISNGMSILTPATSAGGISFGSPTDNRRGRIVYDHSADKMQLYTAGAGNVRMTIDNAGNVGIGTTSPGNLLSVAGNISLASAGFLGFTGATALTTSNYALYGSSINTYLNVATGGSIGLNIGNNSILTITGSNVGIGTTSPADKLEIYNGTYHKIKTFFEGSYTSGFKFSDYNGGIKYDAGNDRLTLFANYTAGTNAAEITFETSGSEKMRIDANGNVGIGSTSPGAKLDVTGNVRATSFTGSFTGSLTGLASNATTASYVLNAVSASFATFATTATSATTATAVVATVTGTNSTELVRGNMADNDQFRILVGGTAGNAGFVEIATADDGTEPIYVRQYTGVFSSLIRTATLLDGSGNTSFPGNVGIGTTSPATALDIRGRLSFTSASASTIFAERNGNYHIIYSPTGNPGIYIGNASDTANYYDNGSHQFRSAGGGTYYAVITSAGSVGIGTTSPTARLHVSGTTGGVFEVDGAAAVNALYVSASGRIGIGNITPGYTLDVTGNIHTTTTMYIDASNAAYLRGGDDHEWWDINVANTVGLYGTSNSAVGAIKLGSGGPTLYGASGNLGIGTTSPSGRLTTAESVNSGTANVLYLSNPSQTGTTAASLNFINADSTIKSSIIAAVYGNDYMTFNVGSNTERMRINASGNVGIGTTSPGQALDVNGRIRIGSNAQTEIYSSSNRVVFRGENTDNVAQFAGYGLFLPITGQAYNLYQAGSTLLGYTDTTATLDIARGSSGAVVYVRLNSNGNSYLNGGNVGIGTTSPAYKLEVNGATGISGQTAITSDSTEQITIRTATDTNRQLLIGYNYSGNYGAIQAVQQGTAYRNLILNQSGGNVGIGTTSPGEKLHVVGNIKLNNGNAIYLGDSANNNGGRIYVDTGTNNFYINQANNSPLYFATNNGTKATILGNGNFGIGTTDPSYKLHITETTSADCRLQIENTSTGNAGIEIVGGGGNQYIDFTPVASTDFEGRIIYSSSSDEMQFMTNITNRFKLNSNGAEVQNGALGVGVAANSTDGRIDASNDIVAYSSDKRLKTNIQSIENPLDKIGKLSGFTYNWNDKAAKLANYDTNESLIGVFAQEVQAVLPEAVKLAPFDNDGNNKSISGENYLTVQYEKIVPLLIEAIKEQQKQIDDLKYLLSQK
jgi:hypothetical protein